MQTLKSILSPAGREIYSDIHKYVTERLPRLYNQIIGEDLRYFPQILVKKEHVGSRWDGKVISVKHISPGDLIYSFGIGRDISFDIEMIEKYGAIVHAFDPTPVSKEWLGKQALPKEFHFHDFGVADYDGYADFFPFSEDDPTAHDFSLLNPSQAEERVVKCPVYKLDTIMKMLGHQKIDILKMDVEGVEYGVITDFLASNIKTKQILVEFHHRFGNIGLEFTDRAIKMLNQHGYKIFSIGPDGQEYSFVRE